MLDVINVKKVFSNGTPDEKTAINNESFHLDRGDFVTVIGANGAGKSTLFNLICGTFFTDEGRIILDGKDITFTPEHIRARQIGRLFQDPMKGTAPGMTVEENLSLAAGRGGWLSRTSKKEKAMLRERVAELNMGLEDRMTQPVGLLSGGQRQALTLVMATVNLPKLLLLDEHTAALDPGTAEKVLELTKKVVSENNLTCMMITHNMNQALEFGNRTFMMNDGHIIFDTSGEERNKLTVDGLLEKFREGVGRELDNDRMRLG